MDTPTLLAFAVFVITMTGTPGPGNLAFLAMGAAAGYRSAFPVILAAVLGGVPLGLLAAYGLGHILAGGGAIATVFKTLSFAYMCYLAWRIVGLSIKPKDQAALPSFWEGLMIHPLSPKTWAMVIAGYTAFFGGSEWSHHSNAAVLVVGFALGGLVFHSLWALAGSSILALLSDGPIRRAATISMAVLMLAATIWALVL